MFKDEPSSKFINEYEAMRAAYDAGQAQPAPSQTFDQSLEKAVEAFAELGRVMATYAKQVTDKLFPIVKAYADLVAAALKTFPNRRVVHLALYAKKPRTRKKNMRRIIKWMEDNT